MERLHGNQPSLTWDPSRAVPSDLPRAVMSDCPPHPSGPAGDSSSLTRPLRAAGRCQRGAQPEEAESLFPCTWASGGLEQGGRKQAGYGSLWAQDLPW